MSKFKSRKLWVSLAGMTLIAVSGPLGLGGAAVAAIGAIVAAYVGGQAWQDGRREYDPGDMEKVYQSGFGDGYQYNVMPKYDNE